MLPLLLCITAILIVSGGAIYYWCCHPLLIFSDQGLYMQMADLLLKGKLPYVDMFEINPPLAIYLHVVPVLAARLFHITMPLAFAFYMWALILSAGLIAGMAAWRAGSRGALYICIAAIYGMVSFSQGQTLDFGQRDHIFAILYFPFFIIRYLRWQGLKVDRPLAVVAGIMGGIGIALKHYFVPVALAAEIVWALDKRAVSPLFRAETVAAMLTMLVYALHFFFLPRVELETFFSFIVPIYQAGYSYYMTSISYNFFFSRLDLMVMSMTTIGAVALAGRNSFLLPIQAFSLMAAVFFVLAGQVWTCHTMEIRMASQMAIFVLLLLLAQYLPPFILRQKIVGILAGLALIALAICQIYTPVKLAAHDLEEGEVFFDYSLGHTVNSPRDDIDPWTRIVLARTRPDESILFISSAMAPGYPVYLQTNRRPASRLLHGMVVPMLGSLIETAEGAKKKELQSRLRQILDWYGEDIKDNRPRIIFVQIRFVKDILEQRGFFKKEMAGYKKLLEQDDIGVYVRE